MRYLLSKNGNIYLLKVFSAKKQDNLTAFIPSLPRKGYNHSNFLF